MGYRYESVTEVTYLSGTRNISGMSPRIRKTCPTEHNLGKLYGYSCLQIPKAWNQNDIVMSGAEQENWKIAFDIKFELHSLTTIFLRVLGFAGVCSVLQRAIDVWRSLRLIMLLSYTCQRFVDIPWASLLLDNQKPSYFK